MLGLPALAADPWGGTVAVTSDYVLRGVSQTGHAAAAQADIGWRSPLGWFAGAWASTVDPPPGTFGTYELNLYAGHSWTVTDRWGTALRYVRYMYPNSPFGRRYDSDELSASLEFEDRLVLSVAGSPNATRYSSQGLSQRGRTLSYEASMRQTLWRPVSIVAAVGYYDTKDLFGTSYWAWNAGLSARVGPVEATLNRFGTDAAARRLFETDVAHGRSVLSAAWPF